MSITLLDRVSDHVNAAGFEAGYKIRFFRFNDRDIKGNNPFIVYRQSNSGLSNILLQQPDVMIQLCQNPDDVAAGDARLQDIARLFRGDTIITGIVRFDPITSVTGPFYLHNGRPIWELVIRCFTEDQ